MWPRSSKAPCLHSSKFGHSNSPTSNSLTRRGNDTSSDTIRQVISSKKDLNTFRTYATIELLKRVGERRSCPLPGSRFPSRLRIRAPERKRGHPRGNAPGCPTCTTTTRSAFYLPFQPQAAAPRFARPQGFSKTPGVLFFLPAPPPKPGVGSQAGQAAAQEKESAGFWYHPWA